MSYVTAFWALAFFILGYWLKNYKKTNEICPRCHGQGWIEKKK